MRPRLAARLALLAIGGVALLAYHNSFGVPFVFDDASSIVTNPTIRRLWPLTDVLAGPATNVTAQGRPLLNLSLALNYAAGGTAVAGYHVVNLLIHAVAGLVLFGIVRRLVGARVALATALIWVAHPLQTESVTYTIQRTEALMALFYLLTFYGFVRAVQASSEGGDLSRHFPGVMREPGRPGRAGWWLGCSVVACAAGMATKEVMATTPLMVLLFDRTFVAGRLREAWRLRRGYYLGLVGTWLLLAWLVFRTGGNRGGSVGFGVDVAPWDYWLTQFKAVAQYLRLTLWPQPLVFEYGSFWIERLGGIVVEALLVFSLLAATIAGLWRRAWWGFLGAWFFGVLAPTSLAPGTTQMIVEHRMYLALAAPCLALAVGLEAALRPRARMAVLVALVGGLTLRTIARNEDYRTEVALWRDTIAQRPANPLAHFMLASAWERAGQPGRAQASYEEALRLKPDFSIGHENLGELLLRQSRPAEAIASFEAALRLQPEFADAHMNLGNALLFTGHVAEALAHLATAVRLNPDLAEPRYNLGQALAAAGRREAAQVEWVAALARPAGSPEVHRAAHAQLADALALSGRPAAAVPHYEAVLRMRPDDAAAHHNLGSALFELGRLGEAARHYESALRLAPDFPGAREHLALVRARLKN